MEELESWGLFDARLSSQMSNCEYDCGLGRTASSGIVLTKEERATGELVEAEVRPWYPPFKRPSGERGDLRDAPVEVVLPESLRRRWLWKSSGFALALAFALSLAGGMEMRGNSETYDMAGFALTLALVLALAFADGSE